MGGKKSTYKDRIKAATSNERFVSVCLQGNLWTQAQDLDEQLRLMEAQAGEGGRFVGNPDAQRLADELEAVTAEIREHTEKFVFRALPGDKFKALRREHPPRDGEAQDVRFNVNIDTLADVLVPRCIVEPKMDDEDWEMTKDKLSDGQLAELFIMAWNVNETTVSIPFSPAASKIRNSVSESKRPND